MSELNRKFLLEDLFSLVAKIVLIIAIPVLACLELIHIISSQVCK